MQKLKNIEFLRTFLIFAIIIHHAFISRSWTLCNLYPQIEIYTEIKHFIGHAYNAVEAFFIMSGFFLGISKNNSDIKTFIKKKYIRLSPVIIFSMLICVVGTILGAIHFNVIANLMSVLLINHFGICLAIGQNPILWYTSALFAGLLIYFIIIKNTKKPILYVSILSVISYLVLNIIHNGQFNNPLKNVYYVINIGFLRALGGIGVGILIAHFWKNYQKNRFKFLQQNAFFYTIGETLFLSLFIWWLVFPHAKFNNTIFVFIFVMLFGLFLIKKGAISKFFDTDIWLKLGKYQYSLFVNHYIIIKLMGLLLWKNYPQFVITHPMIPILSMILLVVIISVFAYHFVECKAKEFF